MWTDWQGTSVADAKANLAGLRAAILTGSPTRLAIAGVVVEYATSGKAASEPRRLIQELQRYLWEIEENDWDHTRNLSPADSRPLQTLPEFL